MSAINFKVGDLVVVSNPDPIIWDKEEIALGMDDGHPNEEECAKGMIVKIEHVYHSNDPASTHYGCVHVLVNGGEDHDKELFFEDHELQTLPDKQINIKGKYTKGKSGIKKEATMPQEWIDAGLGVFDIHHKNGSVNDVLGSTQVGSAKYVEIMEDTNTRKMEFFGMVEIKGEEMWIKNINTMDDFVSLLKFYS
jgi:hypothetical protein